MAENSESAKEETGPSINTQQVPQGKQPCP